MFTLKDLELPEKWKMVGEKNHVIDQELDEKMFNDMMKIDAFQEYGVKKGKLLLNTLHYGALYWFPWFSEFDMEFSTKWITVITFLDDIFENYPKEKISSDQLMARIMSVIVDEKYLTNDPTGAERGLMHCIEMLQQSDKHPRTISFIKRESITFFESVLPLQKTLSMQRKCNEYDYQQYLYLRKVDIGIQIMIANNHFILDDPELTSVLMSDHRWVKIDETAYKMISIFNDLCSYTKEFHSDGAISNPLTIIQQQLNCDLEHAFKHMVEYFKLLKDQHFEWRLKFIQFASTTLSPSQLLGMNTLLEFLDSLMGAMYHWHIKSRRYIYPDSIIQECRGDWKWA